MGKNSSGKDEFLLNSSTLLPDNAQDKPSRDSRRAVEEKMFNGLFYIILTEHTTISFL
jgi:hypothetical protein